MPDDVATVIIHNDYRMDNLVLDATDPQKIIGVLDWEMATLGDPLMDLGNTLAYWIQADDDRLIQMLRRQPTHLKGMLSRQEVVDYYCQKMNLTVDNWTFYEVWSVPFGGDCAANLLPLSPQANSQSSLQKLLAVQPLFTLALQARDQ